MTRAKGTIATRLRALLALEDYWHPAVSRRADPGPGALAYPVDFAAKATGALCYDDDGVMLTPYPEPVGRVRFPIDVAQLALGLAEAGGRDPRFRAQAAWLARLVREDPDALVRNPFPWLGLPAGWPSAMGQGQAISVLVRAHALDPGGGWLDAARRAEAPLRRPLDAAGLWAEGPAGGPFPEESPHRTHILNGAVFALWGLEDLEAAAPDAERWGWIERFVAAIAAALPRFDLLGWSRYDLRPTLVPNPATRFYHAVHVQQLRVLEARHGAAFTPWRRRWERSLALPGAFLAPHLVKAAHKLWYEDRGRAFGG